MKFSSLLFLWAICILHLHAQEADRVLPQAKFSVKSQTSSLPQLQTGPIQAYAQAGQAGVIVLDSALTEENFGTYIEDVRFTYFNHDSLGNPGDYLREKWNRTTQSWDTVTRGSWTYDDFGTGELVTSSEIILHWNPVAQIWDTTFAFTLDDKGIPNLRLAKFWDPTNQTYNGGFRIAQTYDADSQLTDYQSDSYQLNLLTNQYRWVSITHYSQTFQANGLVDERITYSVDQTGNFGPSGRQLFTYNTADKLTEALVQSPISFGGQWANDYRESYTYVNDTALTMFLRERTVSNLWENRWRDTIYLNAQLKPIREIRQLWTPSINDWRFGGQFLRNYDAQGNEIYEEGQIWDASTNMWVPNNRTHQTFDAQNRLLTTLYDIWEEDSLFWVKHTKDSLGYDPQDQIVFERNYRFDVATDTFFLTYGADITLNPDGSEASVLRYIWEANTLSIQPDNLITYTYNTQGSEAEMLEQYWDANQMTWINLFRIYRNFDTTDLRVEEYYEQDWNPSTGVWDNFYFADYFYSNKVLTAIQPVASPSFRVYPNPTADILHVKGAHIRQAHVIDASGKLVWQSAVQQEMLDLTHLMPGLYILALETLEGKILTTSILKQ